MEYQKPLVTIELAEYNELLEKVTRTEETNPDNKTLSILLSVMQREHITYLLEVLARENIRLSIIKGTDKYPEIITKYINQ